MGQGSMRNGLLYVVLLAILAVFLFTTLRQGRETVETVAISQIAAEIKAGKIEAISEKDGELSVTYQGASEETAETRSRIEAGAELVKTLNTLGVTNEELNRVKLEFPPSSRWENWAPILGAFLPILLIGAFFFFILRQAQGAGNQAFSFGKSKARMFTGDKPTVTFDDVAGAYESKEELKEVVEFLKEPQKFAALGARIPKGVLLVGPPGTGKTLMAKAVSGEAGVPFFSISGSEFVEMFVGVGASRVRDLFDQAKRNSPCIIFVDEIDAVGRHRGAGLGGSHDEREQTLNQILVEMDGFDTDTNIIIIAATNRPDILDPALLRPGRFDRRVVMDQPDVQGREEIFKVHVRGKPLAEDVDLEVLARATPGFVGADIENMVNEGAILAARRNRRNIGMTELTEAIERVAIGPERKSRVISEDQKQVIAYHEAGHALVQEMLPHTTRGAQGDNHWPRHGGRLHVAAGQGHHAAQPHRDGRGDLSGVGRPGRRGNRLRQDHNRRFQRPRTGDPHRTTHGHGAWHERPHGAADLRAQGRDDVHGPRNRRAPQLQRRRGRGHRPRGAAHHCRGL